MGETLPQQLPNMNAVSQIIAQQKLAAIMEQVCSDHVPTIITRDTQPSVVMISLEDYQSLEETAYLLRSPNNAQKLMSAIEQLENGQGVEKELLE
jgi:antitoxin YefM